MWVSIFVNPTQFDDPGDLDRYPRTFAADLEACRAAGVDAVFAPTAVEMYPEGAQTVVEVLELTRPLCGRTRPGHFNGVTTVVAKLLLAAKPHVAVFGEKDFQQLAVIRRMVRDLHVDVEIVSAPTVRENDGLAPTQAQRDALMKYYMRHVLAGMTQPAALDDAMRFPNWRKEIVGDLERLQGNPALYRYVRDDLCFKYLKQWVVGNYHPACRYNAALTIGMLNDQEGKRNTSNPYAVPYAKGREFLIEIVRAKGIPDAVRIAALIGLRRHAELLAAGGSSDASMVRPLVDVIRAKVSPTSSSADAAYWQKRVAIEALGATGLVVRRRS